MRIFLAGATGVIGKRLVPLLLSSGHRVTGMTRTETGAASLRSLGAEAAIADGLDRDRVREAMLQSQPNVVIHQMTALRSMRNLRRFDDEFAVTNRLRTEGTEYLMAAAREAGASRFVAQSYAGWPSARTGGRVKSEDDPLASDMPALMKRTLAAIRHVEESVSTASGFAGIVLRYGGFYGPGTSLGEGGEFLELIRQRKLPVFGNGAGVWSFLHIDDAAKATHLATETAPAGIYNIVDDEPVEVSRWIPYLAEAIGAKPPLRLPAWVGRLVIGEAGMLMMTEARGSSNDKARRIFGWRPEYASWRTGFRGGL